MLGYQVVISKNGGDRRETYGVVWLCLSYTGKFARWSLTGQRRLEMSTQLSRRQFLQVGLGVVGTTLVAACMAPAGAPGTSAAGGVQPAKGPVNITLLSTI